jgi:hypothetical protein
MSKASWTRVLAACIVLLAIALVVVWTSDPAFGQRKPGGGPAMMVGPAHYTVVMTEGHNLLVTDNATNKLFFYTTDKDKPIGTPLKLRAELDLSKVGEPEIKITPHNLEKVEEPPAKK